MRVIAGEFGRCPAPLARPSPVRSPAARPAPLYLDVALEAGATLELATPAGHRVLAYVFEGEAEIGGRTLAKGGSRCSATGRRSSSARRRARRGSCVIGGRPLREPVVHYGPFVMNTVAEIEQAVRDFRSGRLTDAA